ncbi:MAG: hypothetical protein R2882_07280 [Gemmatimonadales bacterium]
MTTAPVAAAIHPSAVIDPDATLGVGVEVGPFAMIGPQVTIGDGCRIGARATIERNARLAAGVSVGIGSVIGGDPGPQVPGRRDLVEIGAYDGDPGVLTINRGTSASGLTSVGEQCFVMSYVHIAHDCRVGDRVIVANGTQLAGHVTVHERAILSGLVAIHQFVTIGTLAFVGGCSRVNSGHSPLCKGGGNPVELFHLNGVPPARRARRGRRGRWRLPALLQFGSQPLPGRRAGPPRGPAAAGSPAIPGVRRPLQPRRPVLMTRLPVGVIGVGALGRFSCPPPAAAGAQLVGVNDIDEARGREVADSVGSRFYAI